MSRAVFQGNATQLSWAWSSATRAPFYAPYTGFHVELPAGLTVMNYNEGFNSKIRMISHRAFGFHSADALIAMIMLLCSGITLSPLGHGKALHTL